MSVVAGIKLDFNSRKLMSNLEVFECIWYVNNVMCKRKKMNFAHTPCGVFPLWVYMVNYLLVIELISQFLLFGTFKIWYLKSAYVPNWMDITYRPAPRWASPACLMWELKNEIKVHFPLSISRTARRESVACSRHLAPLKSVKGRDGLECISLAALKGWMNLKHDQVWME